MSDQTLLETEAPVLPEIRFANLADQDDVETTDTKAVARGPQNRDPKTGRILSRVRDDIEDSHRADFPKKLNQADPDFTPVRIWTAGPGTLQEKIYMPGRPSGLKPYSDGAYYVKTKAEYDVLLSAIGKRRMFRDDIPEDEPAAVCQTCQWSSRSYKAMNYHLNVAHGRPQE